MQDKINSIIEQLTDLRGDLCDIENKRGQRSILSIDRIDMLVKELNSFLESNPNI